MIHVQQLHHWPTTTTEALAIQESLRDRVLSTDQLDPLHYVAGVDVGFEDGGKTTRAAVAVLSFPDLMLQESTIARRPTPFPYIPGFLSFREVPAVLDALEKLTLMPQILLCDGQGIAHPRRFGIACHLGVLVDLPTIGVAKSRLVGKHADIPEARGEWVPLLAGRGGAEVIGAVVRSRPKTKPLYVSIGHRLCLETAIQYVMACTTRYRLPETTRWSHKLASVLKSDPANPKISES